MSAGYEPSDQQIDELLERYPNGMTLEQIAGVLHCSKQRAHQLVDRAIDKVLRALQRRGLGRDDLIGC